MVKSMTGYGRSEKVTPTAKCSVEIKSVNHRYLDMSIKLPRKLNMFEADIREVLKDYIQRGKVDVFVSYEDYSKESVNIKYNQEIAAEYMKYFAKMVEDFELDDDIRVSTLARMPEVLVSEDENINEDEIWKLVKEVLLEACDAFVVSRIKEGENLRTDLLEKLENGLEDVFPNNVEVELVESDCINILDLTTVIYDPETEFSEETEYEVYFDTPMELGAIAKLVFAVPFENSVEYYVVDAIGNENGCPGSRECWNFGFST